MTCASCLVAMSGPDDKPPSVGMAFLVMGIGLAAGYWVTTLVKHAGPGSFKANARVRGSRATEQRHRRKVKRATKKRRSVQSLHDMLYREGAYAPRSS